MIDVRHSIDGRGAFRFVQSELRAEDIIVIHQRSDGVPLDDALLSGPSVRAERWPGVIVCVDGEGLARCPGGLRELAAGQAVTCDDWRSVTHRSTGRSLALLRIAWRRGGPFDAAVQRAGGDVVRLSPAARAALRELAEGLELGCRFSPVRARVSPVLQALAVEGLGVRAGVPPAPVHPVFERVARAVEQVLARMEDGPAGVDFARALGCCEPHALRLVNDYLRRFHLTVRGWRQYLFGTRVSLAVMAMSVPGATTEAVAGWLGFSSATSLCHAFTLAGLPAPGRVREALARCA